MTHPPSLPLMSSSSAFSFHPLPLLLPLLLLLSLFPSPTLSTYFQPECGNALLANFNAEPCTSPTTPPWSPRAFAHTFEWAGGLWIVGGLNSSAIIGLPNALNDVWGSYDLGHSWVQRTPLPGPCTSSTTPGIIYAKTVYLFCSGYSIAPGGSQQHSSSGESNQLSYRNSDVTLNSAWTTINDGLNNRIGFSVNRMAVPFDDFIGTLVLLNGAQLITGEPFNTEVPQNDVWTFSATGSFSPEGVWTQYQSGGSGAYHAPWLPRVDHFTTNDAEGLVIIMAGGFTGSAVLNDVWQLSWENNTADPFVYQLNPGGSTWTARKAAALYMVHDTLFLYGGSTDNTFLSSLYFGYAGSLNDVWQSLDYGTTWNEVSTDGTNVARHGVTPVSISRRFFVLGGSTANDQLATSINYLADVWIAYW